MRESPSRESSRFSRFPESHQVENSHSSDNLLSTLATTSESSRSSDYDTFIPEVTPALFMQYKLSRSSHTNVKGFFISENQKAMLSSYKRTTVDKEVPNTNERC